MGKSVMFVCNASSFMVNAILGNLKTEIGRAHV